jgi:pimeloyl-ACP methyl ester carboxylesterase
MLDNQIARILAVSGAVTMLPVLQFFAPVQFLEHSSGIVIADDAGLLFARHWGLLAFSMGALLVYAARHPEARKPIVLAAAVEKLGLVVAIALAWGNPAMQGLHLAAIFDGACVLLYATWLLGIGRRV